MSLNIQTGVAMSQNNVAFRARGKGLGKFLVNPVELKYVEDVLNNPKLKAAEKEAFLKAQALRIPSGFKDTFMNIIANLKQMFSVNS